MQVVTTPDFPGPQLAKLDTLNLMFVDLVEEQHYQVSSSQITWQPQFTVLCRVSGPQPSPQYTVMRLFDDCAPCN